MSERLERTRAPGLKGQKRLFTAGVVPSKAPMWGVGFDWFALSIKKTPGSPFRQAPFHDLVPYGPRLHCSSYLAINRRSKSALVFTASMNSLVIATERLNY